MTSKRANEVVDLCSPENSDDDDDDAIYDLCSDAEPELDAKRRRVTNDAVGVDWFLALGKQSAASCIVIDDCESECESDGCAARRAPLPMPAAPRPTPEQRGGVRIIRDAHGVPGLDIALDVFGEGVEERIFANLGPFQITEFGKWPKGSPYPRVVEMKKPSATRDAATGLWTGRTTTWTVKDPTNKDGKYQDDWFRLVGAARDLLRPGLVPPDEVKGAQYFVPGARGSKSMISNHFDPQDTNGEVVIGVSLGADAILVMQKCSKGHSRCTCTGRPPDWTRRISLPRRSMYILSGAARYSPGWTHGLAWPAARDRAAPPPWNPTGERRSITMRTSIPWNLYALEHGAACGADAAERAARLVELRRRAADRKPKPGRSRRPAKSPDKVRSDGEKRAAQFRRAADKLALRFPRGERNYD